MTEADIFIELETACSLLCLSVYLHSYIFSLDFFFLIEESCSILILSFCN